MVLSLGTSKLEVDVMQRSSQNTRGKPRWLGARKERMSVAKASSRSAPHCGENNSPYAGIEKAPSLRNKVS